jgi:hypothetical protein
MLTINRRFVMQHPSKIFFLGIIVLLFVLEPFAYAKEKYVKPDDIVPILDEIDRLNKRLDKLDQQEESEKLSEKDQELLNFLKQDMAELTEILERVETKSIVDRLEIGAEIRTRIDWYTFHGHDNIPFTDHPQGKNLYERIHMQPSNRFRLNLRAQISDNLKFTSRLSMMRHWSDDDFPVYPDVNFLNSTRVPGNINLKVERAYVDYFFEPNELLPIAFTFGRMPSTDGLPTDFRENTPRKSTYPAIAYNVESDGIALSLDLEPLTHLPQTAARLIGSLRYDDHEKYFMGHLLSDKKGVYRIDEEAMDPIYFIVFQLESHIPDFFGGLLAIMNVLYIPQAPKPDFRYNESLAPFYEIDGPLFTQGEDSLGYLTKYTLFVESKEFFGFNFDWFAGLSYLKTHAKGATEFMLDPEKLGLPGNPLPARDAYDLLKNYGSNFADQLHALENAPTPIGLLNNDGKSDHDAHCIHVGGRIDLPFPMKRCPKLGIEYNHGSKYWANFGEASEDPLHKLATRGEAWDFYLLQPVSRFFMFRIGHTVTRHDYDQNLSFYYGEPLAIDHKVTNTYLLMDAKF